MARTKPLLTLALAVALVAQAVPAWPQEPLPLAAGADGVSLPAASGPIERSALRLAAAMEPETAAAQEGRPLADWALKVKRDAARIPVGKKVRVKTLSGEKVQGTLRAANEEGVVIEQAGAAPVEVPYDAMGSIKRPMGTGTKVAIGAGIGVGALAALLIYAMSQPWIDGPIWGPSTQGR